ncbi:MAG: glycosyltransferase family 4 protein [Anaerolineae bacterium]
MMSRFKGEPVHLLIVGSGPEEAFLRQETAERGLDSQVHFLGFVEEQEKFRILRMSDIYASTSQHEGFGLVFLEGMACELPVICYDNGGQTDFLRDKMTGFLVPLNDLDLFIEQCETLIRNPVLRRGFGQNNLQLVEDFFIDSCATKYETLFHKAVVARSNVKQAWTFQERTA